jgi:hypothetical protein
MFRRKCLSLYTLSGYNYPRHKNIVNCQPAAKDKRKFRSSHDDDVMNILVKGW